METVFIFPFPSYSETRNVRPGKSFESTGTAQQKKNYKRNIFLPPRPTVFFKLIFKLVHRSERETGDIGPSIRVSNTFRRTIRAIAILRSSYFVGEISAVTNIYDVNFLE